MEVLYGMMMMMRFHKFSVVVIYVGVEKMTSWWWTRRQGRRGERDLRERENRLVIWGRSGQKWKNEKKNGEKKKN
jgi:hypothetical protein